MLYSYYYIFSLDKRTTIDLRLKNVAVITSVTGYFCIDKNILCCKDQMFLYFA